MKFVTATALAAAALVSTTATAANATHWPAAQTDSAGLSVTQHLDGWRSSITPYQSASERRSASARLESKGAFADSTYGPVEKIEITVKNTGQTRTNYLSLETPDGKVFVDEHGSQMFIGNCRPRAYPLYPNRSTTCDAYRRLTDRELATGWTTAQDLVVAVFGKNGPKVRGLRTVSMPFDPAAVTK